MAARADPELYERREHVAVLTRTLTFVAVTIVLVMLSGTLFYIIAEQQQIKAAADSAQIAADRIADCTTPKGVCYERSRASTQVAITTIINALNEAETQRTLESHKVTANQEAIYRVLLRLCIANKIECPEVLPTLRR